METCSNKWDDFIIRILNTAYYEEQAADADDPVKKRWCADFAARPVEVDKDDKVSANRALTMVVPEKDVYDLLDEVRKVFLSQPACLELGVPIKICGDTHGQYTDLIRLFAQCGFPPTTNYLFLGDYVDRGKQNLELIMLMFGYKLRFPNNFFLLRGNHETQSVNRHYGFFDECVRRYSPKVYDAFNDTFNCMPLCALVGERILCMHGGMSPDMKDLSSLANLKRPTPCDNTQEGLEMDLIWADPQEGLVGWEKNARGASYGFGKDVLTEFLSNNDLDLIARAHQVVQDGYQFFADRRLVTLFSAPHYCGQFDNSAAVMLVNDKLMCSFEIIRPLDIHARPEAKTSVIPATPSATPMRISSRMPVDATKDEAEKKKVDASPKAKKKEKSRLSPVEPPPPEQAKNNNKEQPAVKKNGGGEAKKKPEELDQPTPKEQPTGKKKDEVGEMATGKKKDEPPTPKKTGSAEAAKEQGTKK